MSENSSPNIAELRRDYALQSLSRQDVSNDPIAQFQRWLDEAINADVLEPNAMSLATIKQNKPCARIVLLKGLSADGFVFFTNYHSDKGQQLAETPHAGLVFFWKELERQVRIEGRIEKVSADESDAYFSSRPRGSQIGAAASYQSQVIASRQLLEDRFAQLQDQWQDQAIPRPAHWGGYRLLPESIEFWQGRRSRLHDRLLYTKTSEQGNEWRIERLEP